MNSGKQLINSLGNYIVQICPSEDYQVDLVTRYIKDGLFNGEAVFVIAKPALRKILKSKLDGLTFDGQALQEPSQLRFFDAGILLSYLKTDGNLEEAAFQKNIVAPMYNAQSKYKNVRTFEEMTGILWRQHQYNLAIQLANSYKQLTDTEKFPHLCTYSLDQFNPDLYHETLELICNYHFPLFSHAHNGSLKPAIDTTIHSFATA